MGDEDRSDEILDTMSWLEKKPEKKSFRKRIRDKVKRMKIKPRIMVNRIRNEYTSQTITEVLVGLKIWER